MGREGGRRRLREEVRKG
ncbi:hypothetical protein E2C01_096597 [Portunus trituberculatus]|uniref:Uncharacterized protein n=1 Tax=Portunus trituberculatus TaxID=210409 RepID=A0A5B7K8N8_PORTR|nr:hypothetical protein [Portunus trituberculatus]